ncbi:MAG: Clp protease N-terminal domain-containing protein, partial [Pseudonocardiales bacterium]
FVAELRGLASAPGARADEMPVVLQRAAEQALDLANNYVGCEHLLLGILQAPVGEVTADALRAVGVDAAAARQTIAAALAGITYARDTGMAAGLTAPIRSALEEIRTRLAHLESR